MAGGRKDLEECLISPRLLEVCVGPRALGWGAESHEQLRGGGVEGHLGVKGHSGKREGPDAGPLWEGLPAGSELHRRWEEREQGLLGRVSRVLENSPEGSLARSIGQSQVINTERI